MKTISKTLFAAIALIVAVFISLSAAPAWAEGENIVTDPSEGMCVTHTMFTNSATAETGITYSVDFTPIEENVDSGFSTTGHAAISSVVFTPTNDSVDTGSTEWTRHYTKQVVLPSANAFPHAGAWMYTISEASTGAAATDTTKWDNSEATYKLRVYIENDDINGGLKYGAWSIEKIDDNDGTALAAPEKVDATYPPTTQSGLLFSSQYIKNQTLTITKEVEGSFADKTHEFPISVKLTLPDWYHDPTSANPAPAISYTDTDNTQQTGTPTYNSTSGAWELVISDGYAHNHSLTATVPVGTRYAIDETNPSASGLTYTPSVSWNVGMPPNAIYNANGGSGDMAQTRLVAGATAAANAYTAPTGKDFLCWNTAADGTGTNYLPGAELPTSSELTLYARWTDPNITVNYMARTASESSALLTQDTYALGDTIDTSYDSSYEGYVHYGWYTSTNKKKRKEVTSSMTLREVVLLWEATATSNHWNGFSSTPIEIHGAQDPKSMILNYERNAPANEPDNWLSNWSTSTVILWSAGYDKKGFSREYGYDFEGWSFSPDSGTPFSLYDMPASASYLMQRAVSEGVIPSVNEGTEITLYAHWTPVDYTVTYDYGFDNLTETDTGSGWINGFYRTIYKTPTYTKPGYVFAGWSHNDDGTGAVSESDHYCEHVFDGSVESLTLYAQWIPE